MDYSNITEVVKNLGGTFSSKHNIVDKLNKSLKNKTNNLIISALYISSLFILFVLGVAIKIKPEILDLFTDDKKIRFIIGGIVSAINLFPLTIYLANIDKIILKTRNNDVKVIKKVIFDKEIGDLYLSVKYHYKKYRFKKIKIYLTNILLPLIVISLVVFGLYNFSYENIFTSFFGILVCSFFISFYNLRQFDDEFYVQEIVKENPECLLDRILKRIDGIDYYISLEKSDVIYFKNDMCILLKLKHNGFISLIDNVIIAYCNEECILLKKFKKSKMCKNKLEVEKNIDDLEKLKKEILKLRDKNMIEI